MLDENDVIDAVCNHLEKCEWEIVQKLNTTEKGIDIIAKNKTTGKKIFVEAKGGTSSKAGSNRYGKTYTRSQVFDRVAKGFFTAAKLKEQYENSHSEKVCLALPSTKNFREYIDQISQALLKLDVKVLWVGESRNVKESP